MSVGRLSAMDPYFAPPPASSGVHENSARIVPGVDLSYASTTFESDTDLLPCSSRIRWSFGRLMPIGVTGPESPVSTITSMALATMPLTLALWYLASAGDWSSNHWALSPIFLMISVFSGLIEKTSASQLPLMPRGSRYTSMKPLIVSTGDALSATHAMSYFWRSLSSPVRYH